MTSSPAGLNRRGFVRRTALAAGAVLAGSVTLKAAEKTKGAALAVADLPAGNSPRPVAIPHFPDRLHAFVWRNWPLVPAARLAAVVGAGKSDLLHLARSMGLPGQPRITRDQQRRSYITVLKRNWHLLPYEQLLTLLDWTPDEMAYTLREDDFLFVKLGNLKPRCEPLKYSPPTPAAQAGASTIARVLREEFPSGFPADQEPLFAFIGELSKPPATGRQRTGRAKQLRFCYSYFALYGDPLLERDADPYPDGYLARLAETGVTGVWLQAVLYKLAPFPWDPLLSARHDERLANLRKLVTRAHRHGIQVFLYLNEPRSMPLRFYESRKGLRGVVQGDHAALCTSDESVRKYLRDAVAHICQAVPDLGGFFTITASENLTNCWSHGGGKNCPRCAQRPPADVIAEVNRVIFEGIQAGAGVTEATKTSAKGKDQRPRLIAWDWGWNDAWAEGIIQQLPKDVALMSVSEWSLPVERGGVKTEVGEYSISAIGPGPRATRHWKLARDRGLTTFAKIQAGNTWEISAVPYIPALENVARHAVNLRASAVDGVMLGWTLGGYPSPNLEVVAEIANAEAGSNLSAVEFMQRVAERRFGKALGPLVVTAWRQFSAAFSQFPYHGGLVYSAPMQVGPANPLWAEPTGYQASMVGFPYDHLDGWRAVYPVDVFIGQFEKVAAGFESGLRQLGASAAELAVTKGEALALERELSVARAAAIHFKSAANQARFVRDRDRLARTKERTEAAPLLAALERTLRGELELARRLFAVQSRDSRIGFEATNHYFYVPIDLAEKVLNCRNLIDGWLPAQRRRWSQ